MLEMICPVGEQFRRQSCVPAAVMQSATKAHAADDISNGCHFALHLLLDVTTTAPLAGNRQEQAMAINTPAKSQAFFVTPLSIA
jgi:hypothetical protein